MVVFGVMYAFSTPVFCSCLDESQQEFQKVLFIPHTFFQGQVEQKWSLPDFCWIPFTKRYTFCFESMLRLWNCEKWKTATHFSFNLTLVKRLRDEKRKIQRNTDHVSWSWFQEKCSKVKKPSFRMHRTPAAFRLLQSKDLLHFRELHPGTLLSG